MPPTETNGDPQESAALTESDQHARVAFHPPRSSARRNLLDRIPVPSSDPGSDSPTWLSLGSVLRPTVERIARDRRGAT